MDSVFKRYSSLSDYFRSKEFNRNRKTNIFNPKQVVSSCPASGNYFCNSLVKFEIASYLSLKDFISFSSVNVDNYLTLRSSNKLVGDVIENEFETRKCKRQLATFEFFCPFSEEAVKVSMQRLYFYDGSCRLSLIAMDGNTFMTCSIPFSSAGRRQYFDRDFNEEEFKDDLIIVKNYTENEGCLDFLTENGIAEVVGAADGADFLPYFPIARIYPV